MQEYRKTVTVDDDREYYQVYLGRLDALNAAGTYAFPAMPAAQRFADRHHQAAAARGIARDVLITNTAGQWWDGQQWRGQVTP